MDICSKIFAESFNNVADGSDMAIKEFYMQFSFDANADNSEFQIIEILGDYEYKYGFEYNAETLTLSFFNKLKLQTDIFRVVYSGIMDTLVASADHFESIQKLKRFLPNVIDKEKEKLMQFLTAIDTGIIYICTSGAFEE